MKKYTLKPLCLAIGMALAGSASAATWDFSGSNFYMKFLDGNMAQASNQPVLIPPAVAIRASSPK